jgi:uncharacterized protein involved in exopolysaccharide biosynthesis
MPAIIERPLEPDAPQSPLWRRLAWLAAIAIGASLTTAAVAYALRALLLMH